MIRIDKENKEGYMRCSSCLCNNDYIDIYKIQIGKSEKRTTIIKLCYNCLCELISKSQIAANN